MVSLKRSEMRIFDDAFVMHSGYVPDSSDRMMAEFFDDQFRIAERNTPAMVPIKATICLSGSN
jgi:hypothetical protein